MKFVGQSDDNQRMEILELQGKNSASCISKNRII